MIRSAAGADRGAVEEIVRQAYAKWIGVIGGKPRPMLADYAALIDAGHVWVLDSLDGLIVLIPEEEDGVLLIDNVAIRPSVQGRGLGRQLLAFAEDRAGALGLPAVRLYTHAKMGSNIALYLSLGYRETAREAISPIHHVVHMRKDLLACLVTDILLRGGRVIDPETGLDTFTDVKVEDGRVTRVGDEARPAITEIDVAGMVVTAGFIDLHSHVPDIPGARLQALDGVTTALELEAGATPVSRAYERAAAEGRPVNFGFAASWAAARMEAVAGIRAGVSPAALLGNIGNPAWQRAATPAQTAGLMSRLANDLADGALGIGVLLGYAPGVSTAEYLAVARLAKDHSAPVFTHARDLIEFTPDAEIDGAEEIVRTAAETGAHMHYCHVNSTSQRHVDRVLELVSRAQREGSRITTEAYPYGSGMTGIGAAFLAPERLGERGLTPASLTYVPTGERVATEERLRELRKADPGGLAIIETLREDDPADRELLLRSLTFPGAVVASDAMPLTWTARPPDPMAWPLPASAVTHPRSAGTFGRSIRLLTRDASARTQLSLSDVLAKCSLLPARVLEARVPAMRNKGRLRAGADADIVIFDPAAITDRASYASSTVPSAGIGYVLVNGVFVVRDGAVVPGALPGRAVRA